MNYIEKTLKRSERATGREMTADELGREFMKLGPAERLDALEKIDADDGPITDIRSAARMQRYRRALTDTHERLRKVDR